MASREAEASYISEYVSAPSSILEQAIRGTVYEVRTYLDGNAYVDLGCLQPCYHLAGEYYSVLFENAVSCVALLLLIISWLDDTEKCKAR